MVEGLARLLDTKFKIPGTNFRFGIDPVIGLVPGLGDLIAFLLSSGLIISIARRGVSGKLLVLMSLNAFLDAIIGSIPILGSIIDFFYKANTRNVKMLRRYYEEGKYQGSGKGLVIVIVFVFLVLLLILIFIIWKLLEWLYQLVF
ncbi:MAG: DUF4112 domain-containing protein [Bacteroidales bacterium]|nr:DUF4112 domain-containing protein [Bacteroidales bacterium]